MISVLNPLLVKMATWLQFLAGMLPVISTKELSNFELTLSPDGSRVGNHQCSNLLDYTEVKTHHGFLTDATKNPEVIGETHPYQYSSSIRGSSTLRFYRNLNLEACLWEFVSYYDMSELLTDCGGTIGTDGQVGKPVGFVQVSRCGLNTNSSLPSLWGKVIRPGRELAWVVWKFMCFWNRVSQV